MTFSAFFQALLKHYVFLIPLVVGVLSEIAKVTITSIQKKELAYDHFLQAGGFPSTHSAFVTSLLIIVWKKTGISSIEFAIAVTFAALIWYDALHSRREIGKQAEALNRLQRWQHFQTQIGHSLTEVLGGVIFGALVTLIGIWMSI
jgi:uncharacterized protein